ncbi:MAG: hypothetical protein J7M25_07895 [Deltaproteobacteria bacterium]|nr:hypothetical protein [Deltaproteobacteria bacterium]
MTDDPYVTTCATVRGRPVVPFWAFLLVLWLGWLMAANRLLYNAHD